MGNEERTYGFVVTETELKHPLLRKALSNVVDIKMKMKQTQDYYEVSEVEYAFLQRHMQWVDLKLYKKSKGFKKYPGEVGKFKGKRVVLVK